MIQEIPFTEILAEMKECSDDYTKRLFRDKVIRVYMKCLKSNRILLATKIAAKYKTELTSELRSDMGIATNYSIFLSNLRKRY